MDFAPIAGIASGVCTVLEKIVTSLAGRLSALFGSQNLLTKVVLFISMLSLGLAPASGAKSAPDAYKPLVQTFPRKFCHKATDAR